MGLENQESITMNKVSGGNGIPSELEFQILKDDVVKSTALNKSAIFLNINLFILIGG